MTRQNDAAALSEGELLSPDIPAGDPSLIVYVPVWARPVVGVQVDGTGAKLQGRASEGLPWVDLESNAGVDLPGPGLYYYFANPPEVRAIQGPTPHRLTLFYTDTALNATLPTVEIQGQPGSQWIVNVGIPSNLLGVNGDLYLDTGTNDVYQKIGGVWTLQANLTAVGADKFYLHTEGPPAASEWTVPHNLGRFPTIAVIDQFNRVVYGYCVEHLDVNTARLTFNPPLQGQAIFT